MSGRWLRGRLGTLIPAKIIVVLLGVSAGAAAEEKYRSPGDMTVEERAAMMQGVSDYNNCVYREGLAKVDEFPDIRQAADAAMEACSGSIDALRAKIESFRFEPAFGDHFVQHARSRAAKNLIPELALRKSGN